MKFLRKYADNTQSDSVVNKWRRKRFSGFIKLIEDFPKPVRILDVGGTENFWVQMGFTDKALVEIIILNIDEIKTTCDNFKYVKGDARDLHNFGDNEFDVVFSNSVIEHVGGFNEQKKMAEELRRTGKKYFVQTPNYYFPIEPHFLFPCFQFLPYSIKSFLVRNFRLGWFEKCENETAAAELINSIRLLKKNELSALFPEGTITNEKLFFMTKSFIVIKGKS